MEWISVKDKLPSFEKYVLVGYFFESKKEQIFDFCKAKLVSKTESSQGISTCWQDTEYNVVNAEYWLPIENPKTP